MLSRLEEDTDVEEDDDYLESGQAELDALNAQIRELNKEMLPLRQQLARVRELLKLVTSQREVVAASLTRARHELQETLRDQSDQMSDGPHATPRIYPHSRAR